MPECIVCKGYYEAGQSCGRCGWDNSPWDEWRAKHVEEQGKIEGLLAFYAPYLYLPFFTVLLAVAFGLMGLGGLWKGITPAAQLLALAVTVCGCLITALSAYGARHDIRVQELLNRVQRGHRALLGNLQFMAIMRPALSILLVFLVTYAMITSDLVWDLTKSFLLDPAYLEHVEQQEVLREQSDGMRILRTRIRQITPFTLMGMYVSFIISFNYFVSLMVARVYAQGLDRAVPKPLFLQEERLAQVVRRQAERILSGAAASAETGGGGESTGAERGIKSWTWDEMERTDSGGVKLSATVECEDAGFEESVTGHRTKYPAFVVYTVKADPWGRIIGITRGERVSPY